MSHVRRTPSKWTASDRHTTPNGNARQERVREIQRARLLAAVAEVCSERGAANITVAHVVSRSGVSRRTFYEHFDDRESCFLAALVDALEQATRYVLLAYDPSACWHERIRAALTAFLSFLDDRPDMGRLLVVESLGAGADALELRKHALARVLAAVDEGRSSANGDGLPPLMAEGVVGGVLSVIHTRLLEPETKSLLELTGPLMSMIALPYLGAAAAKRELAQPEPVHANKSPRRPADPLRDLEMRLTYRTVRVLMSVAANPRCSNRDIARAADIDDQGQASKLLTRLTRLGLIENSPEGLARGAPNAWVLTEKGTEVEAAGRIPADSRPRPRGRLPSMAMLAPSRPLPRVGARARIKHFGGLVEQGTVLTVEDDGRRLSVRGEDGELHEFVLSQKSARFVSADDAHGPRLELLGKPPTQG